MAWIVQNLWLVPALPILAGGVIAVMKQRHRAIAAAMAIGAMGFSFLLALCAFAHVLLQGSGEAKEYVNVGWLQFGTEWLKLGWILDPLTAVMIVMVTFVGLLIFIFSVGYMSEDKNFTRFFCFLALFAGAMLGVVIANSLLLLFMCWELVGLTSYLLIGFWFHKPSAAAAAKKAFIVTRIGDLGFFLGMAWLYFQTGTLLFYDGGAGCLEHSALTALVTHTTVFGLTAATAVGLLIFCGAAGKSGQVPLHVWLPDAMEGPTPVSALIHAATMVAAGVFLIARIYPLMSANALSMPPLSPTIALQVVTWVGAITALFGSLVAVAQFDIKRILAYSTVSQLGYMMIGLGVGGPAVGMFHLITHAFFKALLFLGAGSIIHGCSGEQDIRHMGGIRKFMPVTFVAYTCGMLALCGFPLFAGFWSKDEILHSAFAWSVSRIPFYMGAIGALLTAFYMTRQMIYVFAATYRGTHGAHVDHHHAHGHDPHESPLVMTAPLMILAVFAVFLGLVGTPAWPWFQSFLEGEHASFSFAGFGAPNTVPLMIASTLLVFAGLTLGWYAYGRKPIAPTDVAEGSATDSMPLLSHAFYIDAIYGATLVRLNSLLATISDLADRFVWNGLVQGFSHFIVGLAWLDNFTDKYVVNAGFDAGCESVSFGGRTLSLLQRGRVQGYLRAIGLALIVIVILMLWGAKA